MRNQAPVIWCLDSLGISNRVLLGVLPTQARVARCQ